MAKLAGEELVTLRTLAAKGVSNREAARLLGVSEGTVRYRLRRLGERSDGRAAADAAEGYREAIDAYLAAVGERSPSNITDLHDWLVAEHDYPGSLRNLQRYVRKAFPSPPVRARRRIETPPGAQAQADWAHFPAVWLGGRQMDLLAFVLQLSHSRADAIVWSSSKNQLAWLSCHNDAFRRLGGIPATVRVDNEKTAVSRGAGAWGTLNATYRRYAESVRFHIDACQPSSPEAKGKVERRIRQQRSGCNPYSRHWNDLAELQAWTDERVTERWQRRTCPATGTSVAEAHRAELRRVDAVAGSTGALRYRGDPAREPGLHRELREPRLQRALRPGGATGRGQGLPRARADPGRRQHHRRAPSRHAGAHPARTHSTSRAPPPTACCHPSRSGGWAQVGGDRHDDARQQAAGPLRSAGRGRAMKSRPNPRSTWTPPPPGCSAWAWSTPPSCSASASPTA